MGKTDLEIMEDRLKENGVRIWWRNIGKDSEGKDAHCYYINDKCRIFIETFDFNLRVSGIKIQFYKDWFRDTTTLKYENDFTHIKQLIQNIKTSIWFVQELVSKNNVDFKKYLPIIQKEYEAIVEAEHNLMVVQNNF